MIIKKDAKDYLENHCSYVTDQATRQAVDLLTSLMKMNTLERIKDQVLFKQDMNPIEVKKKQEQKSSKINDLKAVIRNGIKEANQMDESSFEKSTSMLTYSDIADIESALDGSPKYHGNKNSRFTHSEKLQFTKEGAENVTVITSFNEEVNKMNIKI